MPTTRYQAALTEAESKLEVALAEQDAKYDALDHKIGDQTCVFCMDDAVPMSRRNARLLVCRHAIHTSCAHACTNVAFGQLTQAVTDLRQMQAGILPANRLDPPNAVVFGVQCPCCRARIPDHHGFVERTHRDEDLADPSLRLFLQDCSPKARLTYLLDNVKENEEAYDQMQAILQGTYTRHMDPPSTDQCTIA
jgi:hypothetical protein